MSMRGSLVSGVRGGFERKPSRADAAYSHTEHDTPMSWVLTGIALLVIPILFLYYNIVATFGVAVAMAITMVLAGFVFSSVAAYMAGLVGSSNNPTSGITIATILFTSLLLVFLMGDDAAAGPAAAILVGAVVCCAAAIGGDNMQDLKAGYILGATPWRQQLMQGVGVLSAVLVMAPILNLLLSAYGIGTPSADQPNALLAPQATLMAAVAQGVFGTGLPWEMVGIGALIGAAIIGLDQHLARRGSTWRAPVLAVAVGIYLPLELSVPILFGGLIAHYAAVRIRRAAPAVAERRQRHGLLFAAGLITGEALIGIFMAVPIVVSGDPHVIAVAAELPAWAGLAVIAFIAVLLHRVASRS